LLPLPNTWNALVGRVRKDHPDFLALSFGKLRKTGANLVNGEVAGVFLCHGQAVRTDGLADVYTDRPFGKVFKAFRKVEEYLQPMFTGTPENSFPEERKKFGPSISLGQIRRIRSLSKHGYKITKIAELVGGRHRADGPPAFEENRLTIADRTGVKVGN